MHETLDDAFLAAIRHDMLRFARLQLRDDALAEDAVQESLLAALNARESFAGRSSAKTWVFSILRNKIIDTLRGRAKTVNVSALAAEEQEFDETFDALFKANAHWTPAARPTEWTNPEQALEDSQFWAVFDACLTHLPENTARVFMMREFLELETDEICTELKISTSNCHVILHRARNNLRRCLERTWFGQGGPSC
jgi:RNA polymerase sigma-70 factor (ECF subfamily)